MGLSIEDLQPKNFTITVNGVQLEAKPLRLSHALTVSKLGNIFQSADKATSAEIKQAEADMDELVGELVPDLKGIPLDMSATMQVIEQLMASISPTDNKELSDKGVRFDTDPKAPRTGS